MDSLSWAQQCFNQFRHAYHAMYANRMLLKTHGIITEWQTWCLILYGTTCTTIAKKHRAMLNSQTNTICNNCFSQRDSQSWIPQRDPQSYNLHIHQQALTCSSLQFNEWRILQNWEWSVRPSLQYSQNCKMQCLLSYVLLVWASWHNVCPISSFLGLVQTQR